LHCLASTNLSIRGTATHFMAAILMILPLPREEQRSQNSVHMKEKTLSLILIALVAYYSVSATSQAVSPPPDGGYPGGNTAERQNALLTLTTGAYNTAVGWFPLQNHLTGTLNTAIGAGRFFSTPATTTRPPAREPF